MVRRGKVRQSTAGTVLHFNNGRANVDDLLKERIAAELETVAASDPDGLLRPEDVLAFAKANPQSAAHGQFEWDDGAAAHQHRLAQARGLIRVVVTVLPNTTQQVRGFVSLPTDRVHGGGYRRTGAALQSDRMRRQIEAEAIKKITSVVRSTLALLPEFAPLATAVEAAIVQYRATEPAKTS
jgi:hypothetical protein